MTTEHEDLFRKGISLKDGCTYYFYLLSKTFETHYDGKDTFRSYCDDCSEAHLFTEEVDYVY